ncbi:MAG: UvrD-helicase domain-containing protein [Clostridia bacterium]|nr:UvrD-helicase domain-containing protein [Clostridia bacterium]
MAWTKEQQKAIDTRDRTLLVSAAAGSGKTATLTERIIQSILDDKNPADIGRMLIATYTNAAVDELKERIGKAIKKAALENPDNTRLEDQLLRLKDAKILTITSFCNSILRSSAESIGLPPNYRIAEPPEAKILSSSVLDTLITAAYEGDLYDVCTADEFIELADCLSNVKYSEGLSDAIAYIFEKLTYSEKGIDALLPLIEEYSPDKFTSVENTRIGKYIIDYTNFVFSEYEAAYRKILRKQSSERLDEKNAPKAEAEAALSERCKSERSYEILKDNITSFTPGKPSRSGKEEITEFYQSFKVLHSYFTDDLKRLSTKFFAYTVENWQDLYTKLYKLLNVLYKFLKKYYTVFMNEKRKRGICEFSDVERYAYEALYDKDGNITPLATELSSKFDSIYVDEYQDVNGLQSKIFSAIAKDNNRFMVGDIKQSIYCFRSARPEIFADMKDKFPMLGDEGDYPAASIFMSNNFRCDKCVVDFVNGIFDTMFGNLGDSIGYKPEDRLEFSKIYPDGSTPTGHVPEIHIIEKSNYAAPAEGADADPSDEALDEDLDANRAQAKEITKKIMELLAKGVLANGKRIEPRDIAILLRSVKGSLAISISDELSAHGIASDVAEIKDLFLCEEVLLALSFLYSIDNPRKDIYLTAVMLSPIFAFTADEIFKIKHAYGQKPLWEGVIDYTNANPSFEKGHRFISSVLRYRKLAEGQPTDALISMIYRESGLYALAAKNGASDNLILLHSYARKYEQSDFKGVYSFISYVNALIEKGETFPAAASAEEENSVKIMTVHKSKGLEFPVTFIAGASGASRGSEGRIIFSESFGISLKTKDDSGLALVDSPVHNAVKHYISRGEYDEELRVLYVALTRAREMLYVYGTCTQKSAEDYISSMDTTRELLSPYFATKAKSFLDIIMLGRSCGKVYVDSPEEKTDISSSSHGAYDEVSSTDTRSEQQDESDATDKLRERFKFISQNAHLETLPEKISVSKLSPTVLDGSEDGEYTLDDLIAREAARIAFHGEEELSESSEGESVSTDAPSTLPAFITGISERESAKRGIATHTVMQFCDFERLEKHGVESELKRLYELEFISKEDMERVRIGELEAFLRSPLFTEMKNAKKLYRELRFNVKLPADKFTLDEERKKKLAESDVLVQGVIDCIIERDDGTLHLIDYKTDRLTREERNDPRLGEERLRRAHSLQLSYYCDAITKMFGRAPSRIGVYSLHLGKEVDIPIK